MGNKSSTVWNIVLWLVQVLLTFAFGMAGFMKITAPIDRLSEMMQWVNALPVWLVRFIGTAELLGAIGLILPGITKIRPGLVPLAGSGLLMVMVLAAIFHATRGEFNDIINNIVLGLLSAAIIWGRTVKAPFRKEPVEKDLPAT